MSILKLTQKPKSLFDKAVALLKTPLMDEFMKPASGGTLSSTPTRRLIGSLLCLSCICFSGCTSVPEQNAENNIAVLTITQQNLKVGEVAATHTQSQNYKYCYGCVAFNTDEQGPFSETQNVSGELLGAIESQIKTSTQGPFTTSVQYVPVNVNAPFVLTQQSSMSVNGG